jgi:hypothetical protein
MFTHETFSSQLDFINVHSYFQYLKASISFFSISWWRLEPGSEHPHAIQTYFATAVFERTLKTVASRHNCRHTLSKTNNFQSLIHDFKWISGYPWPSATMKSPGFFKPKETHKGAKQLFILFYFLIYCFWKVPHKIRCWPTYLITVNTFLP